MDKNIKKSFLFNLGIVLLLCVVLYMLFFTTLHWVTRHGEEIKIPDIRGKEMTAAIAQLKALHFEVNIDSTYEPEAKPLSVLKQVPDTGSIVKQERTVFLTVNMLNPPHIPMPNLVNLSYRSAEMLLRNNKLKIGDTSYKPDIAGGAILEQNYKGQPLRPGEMIAQGSRVDLVIGNGLGNTEFEVPDLSGYSVDDAMNTLNQFNVIPIIVVNDQLSAITDTATAIVIDQEPRARNESGKVNRIKEGDIINLKIEQNPPPEDIHGNNISTTGNVNGGDKTSKTR